MLAAFLLLAVVMAALMTWSRSRLQSFLSQHAAIRDTAAFEAYKELVRAQMRGALVYLVIGFAGMLLSIGLSATGGLPMVGVVIAVNVPLMLFGFSNKKLEGRIRTLPCADPHMANEHARIGSTWLHKALPDF